MNNHSLSGSFEFVKVSIRHLLDFVRKLMYLKYSCQKTLKKSCGRPIFLEELQAARNFSRVFLHFNKIPNSSRQILQAYLEICIFCVLTKIVLQKQWAKIDLKVSGKSWDEI